METNVEYQSLEELKVTVTTFGANVKVKNHKDERTVWATLTVPDTSPVTVDFGDAASLESFKNLLTNLIDAVQAAATGE